MKTYSFLIIVILLSACVQGNNSRIDDPQDHVEIFFNIYKNQSPADALDYIYSDELIEKGENLINTIENMKTQLVDLEEFLGVYKSHDFINAEERGETLKAYSYLAHYNRQPLLFIFVFHKPADNWKLLHFNYNDGVEGKLIERLQEL